jgi:hypothetical protein
MLMYADVCERMLTNEDVCGRMPREMNAATGMMAEIMGVISVKLTYVDVC